MSKDPLERYVEDRDADAFRELVQRYQALVYGTCQRVLGGRADVEDAVQETFMKFSQHAAEIRSNPGGWLHRCARSTSLNLLKAQHARSERENSLRRDRGREASTTESDSCEQAEDASIVDACIDELSIGDREMVISYFFIDDSQETIASRSGVSQVAIKKRLDRVLEILRRKFVVRGLVVPGLMMVFMRDIAAASTVPPGVAAVLANLQPAATTASQSAPVAAALGKLAVPLLSKWLLALAALLAFAGGYRWLMPKSPPPTTASAEKSEIIAQWDFTTGPAAPDLQTFQADWSWSKDARGGKMVPEADKRIILQFPQALAAQPIVVKARCGLVPGDCYFDEFWGDASGIIDAGKTWTAQPTLNREFEVEIFYFDRFVVHRVAGKVVSIKEYAAPYPGQRAGLLLQNIVVRGIELRYIRQSEVPADIRDHAERKEKPGEFNRLSLN